MKYLLKEVISETFEEKREMFYDIFYEIFEDIGLANAIKEGEKTDMISKKEIFNLLNS